MKKIEDLTGQKFNYITVIKKDLNSKENIRRNKWICKCECGKEISVRAEFLKDREKNRYAQISCGCKKTDDLIGQRFSKLKVIKRVFTRKYSTSANWLCQCDCGHKVIATSSELKLGKRKNCRCGTERKYKEIYGTYFNRIKHSSKNRNIELNITIDYIWDLFIKQNRKCALSGIELCFSSKSDTNDATASLDRIDSSKGYIEGNLQWVHKDINYMKQDLTDEQFINYCKLVANNNKLLV